jgi:hypothetical protein
MTVPAVRKHFPRQVTVVLQEVSDGKIIIQSACALNTVYITEFPIMSLLEPT